MTRYELRQRGCGEQTPIGLARECAALHQVTGTDLVAQPLLHGLADLMIGGSRRELELERMGEQGLALAFGWPLVGGDRDLAARIGATDGRRRRVGRGSAGRASGTARHDQGHCEEPRHGFDVSV